MSDVLLEIGIEELPARFIDDAEQQLEANTYHWLKEQNLDYGSIQTFSTPRRLAVLIYSIAKEQKTIEEEVRGPQLHIAKDENDSWTKAAIGFTKGQGKTVDDIYTKTENGKEYIYVNKITEGKNTKDLLPALKNVIDQLQFSQTMRWADISYRFPRPIRWVTALYDETVIPFEVADVKTSNISYGHRFLGEELIITAPSDYEALLEKQYVIADPQKREAMIVQGIHDIEAKTPFHIEVEQDLLEEVRNLVEFPTVFYGEFERDFLKLPEEVLITSMKEHQRYFPVFNKEQDALLAFFVSVRNGDNKRLDNVIRGNERVLRARLKDAVFFYEEDQQQSIEFYNDKLKNVVFQEKIGTIYEKTMHIKDIANDILDILEVDKETKQTAIRTSEICKFDLVTNMVNEFTELQGIMGEKYARIFGEDQQVATAIREHYLPLQANGKLPETVEGSVVSMADKLDTIAGCFSVGLIPSGSQDPHGLRRQATGVLRILLANNWKIKLELLIEKACAVYGATDESTIEMIVQFFRDRATYLLTDEKLEVDVVRAVLNKDIDVFHYKRDKALLLTDKKHSENFKPYQEALIRVMNIAQKADPNQSVQANLLQSDSEIALFDKYKENHANLKNAESCYNAEAALRVLEDMKESINAFFDHNMVMAEDEQVKQNRLSLMHPISTMIKEFADISLIEWKQHQ